MANQSVSRLSSSGIASCLHDKGLITSLVRYEREELLVDAAKAVKVAPGVPLSSTSAPNRTQPQLAGELY